MVEMGKGCGFPSNFDVSWPLTPVQNGVVAPNGVTANQIAEGPLASQSRATNSLWGRDWIKLRIN